MKKKTNMFLLLILLILIIITIILIVILNLKDNNDTGEENQTDVEQKQEYYNENVSYYDYYKDGQIDIDINTYVKLPDNYLEYEITSNTQEEVSNILDTIIENSEVEIPTILLNGYYGDIYKSVKAGAELEGKQLNQYIKDIYGYDNYEKYIEENTQYFEENIKTDLVYQALAEKFNISVVKSDIEEYFSERLENGDTYESLIETYGEELMYRYTMQYKIEEELIKRLA